jgi:2,3-bisphosphoglycerate-dependent phosphoglycerate mutase
MDTDFAASPDGSPVAFECTGTGPPIVLVHGGGGIVERAPPAPARMAAGRLERTERPVSVFYLVRHAHADWTPDEDRPLSVRGRKDAQRVADILEQRSIGAIYSSPSRRAVQTITPLAARLDLPVQPESDLRERELGEISGLDFFEAIEATWQDPSFAHPDGESNATAQRRGLGVIHRLQAQAAIKPVVLSTHGNLMALILQHFNPVVDYAFWSALTMPDIYLLRISKAGGGAIERLYEQAG